MLQLTIWIEGKPSPNQFEELTGMAQTVIDHHGPAVRYEVEEVPDLPAQFTETDFDKEEARQVFLDAGGPRGFPTASIPIPSDEYVAAHPEEYGVWTHNTAKSGPNQDVPVVLDGGVPEDPENWHPTNNEEYSAYRTYWDQKEG